jgi:D-alanyl-D-alanine carboxypeptidase
MVMRRLVAAAILAVALAAATTPTVVAEPTDLRAALDAAVADTVEQMGVPGATVTLSIPGRIDYTTAYGLADTQTGTPISIADHFRIGSITKTFTGTAVLQLVDQGRLRLTDPISMYVDGVPSGDQITLDMLGRMRTGLANYSDDDTFDDQFDKELPLGPDAFPANARELVDIAFRHPLHFPPGTRYQYCNTNAVLLGMVVEKISGQPLGDYFQQNIFTPLGLNQTSYPPNGLMPEPYSHAYTDSSDGATTDSTFWNPAWADAAGRIVSDLDDMTTWAAALGQGALLQPDTQAQRTEGQQIDPGLSYGFFVFNSQGWIGHNGDIPGYSSLAVYLPDNDATLVVFVNSDLPENNASGQIATAITTIATPDHIYQVD